MSSSWKNNLSISIFGESHGKGIGVVLDGLPGGIPIDENTIEKMMSRRAPGLNAYSTKRKEPDKVEILSGVYNGFTTGTPISGVIYNADTKSSDYSNMPIRPSHGDYTEILKTSGYNDPRGGGHLSGRITAPLVFAGAVAKQALEMFDITVGAFIKSIYTVDDNSLDSMAVTKADLIAVSQKDFPVFDDAKGTLMQSEIESARLEQDSVGGVVGCYVLGVPAGIGTPIYHGLENTISSLIFAIPAVRGIEFGAGFDATKLKGSQHNDPFIIDNKQIKTSSNNHGGITGGTTTGMPISLRVAFKPTPSISQPQKTVDLNSLTETELVIKGRHDPCVVPRAVPCVESAVAIAILDALLKGGKPNVTWRISRKNR